MTVIVTVGTIGDTVAIITDDRCVETKPGMSAPGFFHARVQTDPQHAMHHAIPNGRFGEDVTRSPTASPRRKRKPASMVAASLTIRL